MEMTESPAEHVDAIETFDLSSLARVHHAPLACAVYAPRLGISQRVYPFNTGRLATLALRRTIGMPPSNVCTNLIWLAAIDAEGDCIHVGVEGEYVYQRTGMLATPALTAQANLSTVPLLPVLQAVLQELESILGFEVQGFADCAEIPQLAQHGVPLEHLSLDHQGRSKVLCLANTATLDRLEAEARNYCHHFMNRQREWSLRIRSPVALGLHLLKRHWSVAEVAELHPGDLLALRTAQQDDASQILLGFCRTTRVGQPRNQYEVIYTMHDDDLELEFATQRDSAPNDPTHELVELDVLVGHTSIPLSELCAAEPGTLIELGRHSLPMVTVCVNGEPLLEGELVHFKDQLMVQVTQRLA